MENQNDAPRGDLSIAELRDLVAGKPPAAAADEAKDASDVKPAAEGEKPTAETAPAPGPEDSQAEEQSNEGNERGEDGKFKPSAGVQKRIDKAVKAQRDAERKAAELESRLAALEQGSRPGGGQQQQQQQTNAKPAQQPAAKGIPDSKDFDSYEDYVLALTDWRLETREAARAQAEAENKRNEAQRKTAADHAERVNKAKERYPDWDEQMTAANSLPITREMHTAIVESAQGPDVAYHLASHPEEVRRIAALPPVRQIAELGRIEAQLEKPANTETKTTTAKKPLPKPAANVGGSAGAKQQELTDPDIDISTFKRLARAQLRH